MPRYDNILQTIGNTPLVRLNKLAPAGINVFAKVESFNPLGSVKDRMALAIIEDAERRGLLRPGQTVIEATSGNTGIGLAMVCAQRGYPLVIVMAESFSLERRKLLRFLGARVVLTPAAEKGTGMLNKAVELAEKNGWFLCRQFDNEANAEVHTRTTAPEILADLDGEPLYAFVSGFGTGGTLLGVARGLKAADPGIAIIAAEPDNAPVLASGIPQPRDANGRPTESHPYFRPHLMQGWGPDFVSRLTERAMAEGLIEEVIPVDGNDALRLARALATQEGIFAGTSSGATLAAALEIARRAPPGSNIVCMLPDTGERYMSTPLFEGIEVDMNAAEIELSRSTPGCQFEPQAACPAPAVPIRRPEPAPAATLDEEAENFVTNVVRDHAVVMFALEWCEFCWAVRKLFAKLGIPYQSVDIDSVAFQEGDIGVKIRDVLKDRTGAPTIPQIFIGGAHVGGCMDLFDAMRDGRMHRLLDDAGVDYDRETVVDPHALLPKWVHPRKSA
ncbi:MAG: cysteine synthase A [Gammaproteobacteria bacterium]|nr:cysteine synthase A [Gammaproteobacteria bacterium]MDH4255482.1 cysteine synthase A [Gammaproteobacteria bacterium]